MASGDGRRWVRPVDLPYRDEVDAIFKQIYRDQRWAVMPEQAGPRVLELWGSREQRWNALSRRFSSSAKPWTLKHAFGDPAAGGHWLGGGRVLVGLAAIAGPLTISWRQDCMVIRSWH